MIKYIVIIAVILAVVFFSQQMFFKSWGENTYTWVKGQTGDNMQKAGSYVTDTILPKISGEVEKRGEMVKEGVEQQSQNISESVGEKISNYFAGISDAVLHPSESKPAPAASCPACNCPAILNPFK